MPSSILLVLHLRMGQIQFWRNHSGCWIFWHLFTQFSLSRTSSPSSPNVTSTADNLGAETFFLNSKTEHHRKHQLIIFHQSIKFNKNISFFSSFTDTYLKPPVWSPLRPSVGPRPLPSLQAWNDVDQKKSLDIFLLKINTYAAKLKVNNMYLFFAQYAFFLLVIEVKYLERNHLQAEWRKKETQRNFAYEKWKRNSPRQNNLCENHKVTIERQISFVKIEKKVINEWNRKRERPKTRDPQWCPVEAEPILLHTPDNMMIL